MKLSTVVIAVMTAFVSLAASFGQTQVFMSHSAFGEGGAFENETQNFGIGESGSAYIWVDGDSLMDNGTELFVLNESPDILVVDHFEVFNSDIVFFDNGEPIVFDVRWSTLNQGQTDTDVYRFITLNTTPGGLGIRPEFDGSGVLVDLLYDPTSSAFLYGRIDFTVVDEGQGGFSFTDSTLVWNSTDGVFPPTTRGISINGVVIPEPSAQLVLLFAVSAILQRRKRR